MMTKMCVLVCLVVATAAVSARQRSAPPANGAFPFTIDSIMRGPELVGYPPLNLRWSGDSKDLYFEWRMPKEDVAATWVVNRDGSALHRLNDQERRLAPLPNGTWDVERKRVLGVDRGDIVIIDTIAQRRIDVTRTTAGESNPRWTMNGTAVTFIRDNNLYVVPVATVADGGFVQLTDVAPRPTEPRASDSQRVTREEELKLIDWVEQERERRRRREALDKARALPRFELADRQAVTDGALLDGGTFALLTVVDRAQAKATVVPRWLAESAYTESITSRSRVGDVQDVRRLAIFNLRTGDAVWAGLEGVADPVAVPKPVNPDEAAPTPAPSARPAAAAAKHGTRWGDVLLSPDGKHAVVSIRSLDNTDRWLALVDPATGTAKVLDHLHDDAWVRESGFGWLPDNRRVWFLAERDGWMHLYTVDTAADAPNVVQLTSGKWEIGSVELSPDGSTFYIQSTEAHPGEQHLYALSVDGGARTKLTTMPGSYRGEIAPDSSVFGIVASFANRPPEVVIMPNRAGADGRRITVSPSKEWQSYKWLEPQLITYKARDGAEVFARLYTPEMVGAKRHPAAPAVIFVHGSGYAQNAHRFWSTYYREYMFHHFLASQGYVVLDPDYRASAGYGREWRTAIYRQMGGHDLNDVVDGARFLAATEKVNAKHIGVYGGSYGGFITLMAMFTSPDTFAAGAALRPVTDWSHYNHGYTSNILNEPQSDLEAYRKSSPIYFAEGLKGALLIAHGMVDVNVHFSDSVRLAQRLIELGKENWELAMYPVEDHGFIETSSWVDEYKRIFKLFETHLK